MSDLRELYQELILDHNRQPRNFGPLPDANHQADGYNPLCGDRVTVFVRTADEVIQAVTFDGAGCAISTASASMLTDMLQGRTVEQARSIFEAFTRLVRGDDNDPDDPDQRESDQELLGKLRVFQGVCEFPTRVKCATLVWHTLAAALTDESGTSAPITTE